MRVKALVKSLIPERYRLLRYELYERGRYYPELILSLGKRFECTFCHWTFRRFRPAGFDYPVLKERQVIGASYHTNDVCPRCFSNSRERLLHLFLRRMTDLFSRQMTVLHIAPEPNIAQELQASPNLVYVTGDLMEAGVMAHLDITKLPFADATFDAILCNHVLEHVPSDASAMAELYRVLKPSSWAILQVPIALALEKTIEDPSASTDEERIERFGQRDHVRLYTMRDYVSRLESAGFEVETEVYCSELSTSEVERYALIEQEPIFVCRKPGVSPPTSLNVTEHKTLTLNVE